MTNKSSNLGKWGEQFAKEYLTGIGYKIIDSNYRTRFSEIDLIGLKDNTLIFIEVKTRSNTKMGLPEESINYKKLEKLKNASEFYSKFHSNLPKQKRIDVVSILKSKEEVARIKIISVGF